MDKCIIKFDRNYNNKLSNSVFTTIRKWEKLSKYGLKLNSRVLIQCPKMDEFEAIVVGIVGPFRLDEVKKFNSLYALAAVDTGLSGQSVIDCIHNIYPEGKLCALVLRKVNE